MKRLMKQKDVLELNIDLTFVPDPSFITDIDSLGVAATTIRPVGIDKDKGLIDLKARDDYNTFVGNVFEIISAYDFEILDDFKKKSQSFPWTSEYRWIAHRTEIDADHVPKYIRLRISEHTQELSPDHQRKISKSLEEEAQAIKKPQSKKRQRYALDTITVNELGCDTYEEALHIVEMKVRGWLECRNIDLESYGDPIW